MNKEILCLKLNRNPAHGSGNTTICIFNVEDHLNISENEKEMILDAISNNYSWIYRELSLTREFIKRKMLNSKWKTLEYHNKDFNCTGRLFLEKIQMFECDER